ncbi:LEA type 2 family protein [uncultured Desulfosarcina sp.]|uniref:LEA type 2 family protein n=1 Tax=uncultured Desulfosarcina sp. TaxID=218289 RepID=UPI0029C72368|nr:LEA type 2 family protein [uncultured Desulfosarcina sp.]
MNPKRTTIIICTVFLLMLGGCATIEQLIQKPEITFDSLGTREMSLLEGTFLFRFNVSNPNPVGVHLNDILYDLDINGNRLVSSQLSQGLDLAASGTSPLEIPVTINYLDFFNSLSQLVGADQLDYRISGSAAVGPFRIPYSSSGKLDVPKLPDITVENIKIDSFSLTGAKLKLTLGMKNPNAFAMKMDGLEYAAQLGDVKLAEGKASMSNALGANGRTMMDLDLNLNFLELGRNARTLLSGSSARCLLTGNMLTNTSAGTQKIPFAFDGNVPFTK